MASEDELKSKFVPLLQKAHLRRIIFILNTVGCWPHDVMGQKKWFTNIKHHKVLLPVWLLALLLCLSYMKKNYKVLSFIEFGANYINSSMVCVGVQRLILARSVLYKKTTKDFFCKIHLYHHKEQNDYAMKIFKIVEKIEKSLCILGIVEVYPGALFYMCVPLYKSYKRGMFQSSRPANATFEQAVYYDLPFDYTTNFYGFLFVYIIDVIMVFDVGVIFMVIDYYMMVIVAHLWGHIKILKHNLKTFPKPKNKIQDNSVVTALMYDENESRNITKLLLANIQHYKMTGQFIKQVSSTFEATLCSYFFFFQISLCIFLLEMSEMNLEIFLTYGILTFALSQQLISTSVMFELIGSQSETIKDALYEVPWECMDTKNRKIVLFYLGMVQEPVHIKALGILPVGVQTMSSILKNTLSYFMLLRTTASANSQ